MADVVLIQPRTDVLDSWKKGVSLPLSLLSAARKVARTHKVVLVDQRLGPAWKEKLARELATRPILVGVTSVTGGQIRHALEAAREAKRLSPGTPVAWGGVHGTLLPDQVLEVPEVDVVVRGEGEETLGALVAALAGRRSLDKVEGASTRVDGAVSHAPPRAPLDLDSLDPVPYPIAGPGYLFLRNGRPSAYIETSRGCPFRCSYCYTSTVFRRSWRAQSPRTVLAHIEWLRTCLPAVRHISFTDDSYFVDLDRARAIAEGIERLGADLTYQIQGATASALTRMSDEDLALLAQSGLARVDIGVESGSPRVQSLTGKNLDLGGLRDLNRRLARFCITPWFNFMGGFPGETAAEFHQTIDLALDLSHENPAALVSPIYCLAPYPGTELYDVARREGHSFPATTEGWAGFGLATPNTGFASAEVKAIQPAAYFLSIFADRKLEEYGTFPGVSWLARLYRPIARWRLRRRRFRWLIERKIASIFLPD